MTTPDPAVNLLTLSDVITLLKQAAIDGKVSKVQLNAAVGVLSLLQLKDFAGSSNPNRDKIIRLPGNMDQDQYDDIYSYALAVQHRMPADSFKI